MAHAKNLSLVTLRKNEGSYVIKHFLVKRSRWITYSFSLDSLPDKIIRHISLLNVFRETEDTKYLLNEKQHRAIVEVLKKLLSEQHSNYIFSDHLHKTYLFELIHLVTKIHHAAILVDPSI